MRSTAAVSTMILVLSASSMVESSRNASIPGTRGIATSSRRMSGVSWRVCVTASAPSAASPTTSNSGSASSKRRKPSRKMVWSSAMTMRTDGSFLSIGLVSFLWNGDFELGSMARIRFNHHVSVHCPDSFLDDRRSAAEVVELGQGEAAGKRKALAVIVNYQLPRTVLRAEAHHCRLRTAVFPNIDQTLLHYPCQLAAGGGGEGDFLQFGYKLGCNTRISGKTFYELGNKVKELMGPDIRWPHGLDQFAEVQDLLAQQILDPLQLQGELRIIGAVTAQHVDLHLDTDQRLEHRVVQLARHPGPLNRPGTRTKTAKKIDRIQHGANLAQDVLSKTKFTFTPATDVSVYHHKPASPIPSHLMADHQNRLGSRNRHREVLELGRFEPPSFLVQGGDPGARFLTRALHVESVRITAHDLRGLLRGSDLSRLGELLRRGAAHPLKDSPRAALRDYFVHLLTVKDAPQFNERVVQSRSEPAANPGLR